MEPVLLFVGSQNVVRIPTVSAYLAFGLSSTRTVTNGYLGAYDPVGFGGQYGYYHDYMDRYLLGHRYYDAYAGRFVTRDPIGYKGGINLYGFTGNNPVNRRDPNGTDDMVDGMQAFGVKMTISVLQAGRDAYGRWAERNKHWIYKHVPGAETADKFLMWGLDNVPVDGGGGALGTVTEAEEEVIRLRHYTTTSGSRAIEKEGSIVAKDQNKVFTELARRKALSPTDAEGKYLLKRGHGNAYVEFNARRSEVEVRHNALSGATEHVLNGDVKLKDRNPTFTRR